MREESGVAKLAIVGRAVVAGSDEELGSEVEDIAVERAGAGLEAELARAAQEIEEDRRAMLAERLPKLRDAAWPDEEDDEIAPVVVELSSSVSIEKKKAKEREKLPISPLPGPSWHLRPSEVDPAEVAEIVLRMREFAKNFLLSTYRAAEVTDEEIDAIQDPHDRDEAIVDKVVAREWFGNPYGGWMPRVALEEICPVLRIHAGWVRHVAAQKLPPTKFRLLPPGYRIGLWSQDAEFVEERVRTKKSKDVEGLGTIVSESAVATAPPIVVALQEKKPLVPDAIEQLMLDSKASQAFTNEKLVVDVTKAAFDLLDSVGGDALGILGNV